MPDLPNQNVQVRLTKSKLVVKDLGNPSMVKAQEEGNNAPYVLGVIIGRVTGLRKKPVTNALSGEVTEFDALSGMFEGRRAIALDNKDGTETVAIRSGTCYLPTGIHDMVVETFRSVPEGEKTQLDFAYRICTVKASNPAGYTYACESLYEPATSDPLEHLRSLAMPATVKAVEHKPTKAA